MRGKEVWSGEGEGGVGLVRGKVWSGEGEGVAW